MMRYFNGSDLRTCGAFDFDPFMELRGSHVTDDRFSLEGRAENSLVAWFKRLFLSK